MTARQALTLLESEGVVYRRPPRGTFVAEPRVRFHIGSFSEEVSRLGMHPAARLLWAESQEPTAAVRRALDLDADAAVHTFHRLRTVDGVPFALETTYLPAALTPGILDDPRRRIAVGAAARPVRHRAQPLDRSAGVDRPRRRLQCPARSPARFGRHPAHPPHPRHHGPTHRIRPRRLPRGPHVLRSHRNPHKYIGNRTQHRVMDGHIHGEHVTPGFRVGVWSGFS